MTLLGVFICDGDGRLCFYRSYAELPHALFEDFAFAFSALCGKDGRQTFFAHGQHRLVYLPLDALFIALVTARQSNIIEDIGTLGAVKEAIHAVLAPAVTEEAIAERYCDLAFAFDDMISLGQRTVFSRAQIAALLEMDSTNEKLQRAILLGKEKDARKKAQEELRLAEKKRKAVKGAAAGDGFDARAAPRSPSPPLRRASPAPAAAPGRGLQLRKTARPAPRLESPEPTPAFNPLAEEVDALLEERLNGELSAAGDWKTLELRGSLQLTVLNPRVERWSARFAELRLPSGAAAKIPPTFDKKSWAEGALALREGVAPLATGAAAECLKYALSLSAAQAPFRLTTWFNERETSLELEFNAEQALFAGLDRLSVEFALPERAGARVSDYTGSEVLVERRGFKWVIAPLDASNPSASVVISTKRALTAEELFPAELRVEGARTALGFATLDFLDADGRPLQARMRRSLSSHELFIR